MQGNGKGREVNDTYNAQGWNRKRTDRWATDIPKYAAILTLRKNVGEWRGFIKIDGVRLPEDYTTAINLTPAFVTDSFYKWAEAYVATYLAKQKKENNSE